MNAKIFLGRSWTSSGLGNSPADHTKIIKNWDSEADLCQKETN
jgi:hypothetical protein